MSADELDVDVMLALALLTSRHSRPVPVSAVWLCIMIVKANGGHAAPSRREVQAALDRLDGIGLVGELDEGYALTLNAAALIAAGVLDREG